MRWLVIGGNDITVLCEIATHAFGELCQDTISIRRGEQLQRFVCGIGPSPIHR